MYSLTSSEVALLEGSNEQVSEFFSEMDRKSANEMMRKAGEQFGFATMAVNGMVVAKMATASNILGYSDPSGLSKLLERYQIMTYQIGWFGHDVRTMMRKTFDLSEKDSKATFITWDAFLLVSMYGQTEAAKKMKLYLLKMEAIARVAMGKDSKLQAEARNYDLKRLNAQVSLVKTIERMTSINIYEEFFGVKLNMPQQGDIFAAGEGKQ